MDNFFTAVNVAIKLLNDYQLTIIGTIRKNKREIPQDFVSIPLSVNTSMFGFLDNLALATCILRSNKNVLLLSTMHFSDKIDATTQKPEIIIDYNKTKGGVNIVHKLSATYNCSRHTCR